MGKGRRFKLVGRTISINHGAYRCSDRDTTVAGQRPNLNPSQEDCWPKIIGTQQAHQAHQAVNPKKELSVVTRAI